MPGPQAVISSGAGRLAADDQHRHVAEVAQALQRLPAVELRHPEVEHDEVRAVLEEQAQAAAAALGRDDLVARALEQHPHDQREVWRVVDDQDSMRHKPNDAPWGGRALPRTVRLCGRGGARAPPARARAGSAAARAPRRARRARRRRPATAAAAGATAPSSIAARIGSSSTSPACGELAADDHERRVEQVDGGRDRARRRRRRRRRPRARRRGRPRARSSSTCARSCTGSPRLRSSSSATATGLATVSRQPRLPQRQISPFSTTRDVPDLARDAAGAAVGRPPRIRPSADRRRRAARRSCRRRRARRRTGARRSRRRWRRSRPGPASRAAPRAPPRGRSPSQPGRIPSAWTVPVTASTGAAKPDADADHLRRRRRPARRAPRASAAARVEARRPGRSSTSLAAQRSATIPPPRSQTAARMWRWPKSSPTANAALGASETCSGGRPIAAPLVAESSACCSTIPACSSSASSAVTVARESPSERPRSPRLRAGRRSSVSSSRRRFVSLVLPPRMSLTEAASYRLLTRVTGVCGPLPRKVSSDTRRPPRARRCGRRTGSRRGTCPRARGSRASRRRRSRRPRPRRTGPGSGSPSAPQHAAREVGVQPAERLAGEDVQLDRDQRAGVGVEQLVRRRRRG